MNATNDPVQLGREVSRLASELYGHAAADHELSPEDCHTFADALGVIAHALIRPPRTTELTRRTAMSEDSDALDRAVTRLESAEAEMRSTVRRVRVALRDHVCPTPAPVPAEPEIVFGAIARELPSGSQVIRVDPRDHAKIESGAVALTIGRGGLPIRGERYRVLYRASKPAPRTFHVGDHLHNDTDVDQVPVGTVVRLPNGRYARKRTEGSTWDGFNGLVVAAIVVGAEIIAMDTPDA